MGGGMLKLEPREAARLLFPVLPKVEGLVDELDSMARRGDTSAVEARVDEMVSRTLGVPLKDLRRLREATVFLRNRRTGK